MPADRNDKNDNQSDPFQNQWFLLYDIIKFQINKDYFKKKGLFCVLYI